MDEAKEGFGGSGVRKEEGGLLLLSGVNTHIHRRVDDASTTLSYGGTSSS